MSATRVEAKKGAGAANAATVQIDNKSALLVIGDLVLCSQILSYQKYIMGLRSSRFQRLRVPESNHEENIQIPLPITSNNNELDQIVPEINVSISFIYVKK